MAGADAVDVIHINATPAENVQAVAKAKGRRVTDSASSCSSATVTVAPIGELRESGARVNLIRDGDLPPAWPSAYPELGAPPCNGSAVPRSPSSRLPR